MQEGEYELKKKESKSVQFRDSLKRPWKEKRQRMALEGESIGKKP